MNRPWKIWAVFALCLAVLLAALGWMSLTTLRLDRAQWQAEQQANLEERVRLALWRMDSSLAPLITEESARPASAYESFHSTDRAYSKGFTQLKQGDVLVPSPLLGFASSNILLHFQLTDAGPATSPEVPSGHQRELAQSGYVAREQLDEAARRLGQWQSLLSQTAATLQVGGRRSSGAGVRAQPTGSANIVQTTKLALDNRSLLAREAGAAPPLPVPTANAPLLVANQEPRQSLEGQFYRNSAEYQARANVYQQGQQATVLNNLKQADNNLVAPTPAATSEGMFKPLWLGGELVLARRVNLGPASVIQGCWLNWPHLRQSLLAGVRDLFPAADLQPAAQPNAGREARMLAALPVKLVTAPERSSAMPVWTPVRTSLAVAWGCVLLAGLAVAVLLNGAVSLSERRGAFVSAVTHELRTPLTTFKMYSEMLAEGMVPDEAKRQLYLATLCSEANRLSHLVENVLAYARLERGSARSRVEKLTLGELLARVQPRLEQRATQAGLTLVEDSSAEALRTVVRLDAAAVEQILFNLVDNACKYAAPNATEKTLHLEALPDGKFAMLRVRDHGQGISAAAARRLFQPFSKSAQEAAHTAPGIGLGLALCRRLSRSMGGDLRLAEQGRGGGACFVLRLPISAVGTATIA